MDTGKMPRCNEILQYTRLLKISKCNKGFNWLMHLSKEEPASDRQSKTQDKAAQLLLYDSSI